MRHLRIFLCFLALCVLIGACDSANETAVVDVGDIRAELETLTESVTIPALQRIRGLSQQELSELRQLSVEARFLMESDLTDENMRRAEALNQRLENALSGVFTANDIETIDALSRKILEKQPRLRSMSSEELVTMLQAGSGERGLGKLLLDCEGACVASATAKIVGIEAAFVGGAIGCGAATVFVGVCWTALIIGKNAMMASTALDLAQCVENC